MLDENELLRATSYAIFHEIVPELPYYLCERLARAALAVARPIIEAQEREKRAAEIERLRADLKSAVMTESEYCAVLEKDDAKLRAEIERLRAALRPFATALRDNYSHQSDDMVIVAGANKFDLRFAFKLGDFRAARKTLEGQND